MALPKKGFRTITVNGDQFLWRIRKKISVMEEIGSPLIIPVQFEQGGQLLLIDTGYHRICTIGKPNLIENVTPSLIEKCIKKAIKEGWLYKQEGSPMNISVKEWV